MAVTATEASPSTRASDSPTAVLSSPHERGALQPASSDSAASSSSTKGEMFSANCREELDGHVACVKLFLEEHVKYGTPYTPGSLTPEDRCSTTRALYMRCMQYRKKYPTPSSLPGSTHQAPKPCTMELSMHGSCVERQLERTQKLGQKYWTQGGEDRCLQTRSNYEKCMYNYDPDTPGRYYEGDDYGTVVHRNVKAFDFRL